MSGPSGQVREMPTPVPVAIVDAPPDADKIAAGLHDLASAIREGTEAFKPAADTVHGFGARLDALCTWVTGKWPWVVGFGLYTMGQFAPDLMEFVKNYVASSVQVP